MYFTPVVNVFYYFPPTPSTYVERPANSRDPAGGGGDVPAMLREAVNYSSADDQIRGVRNHTEHRANSTIEPYELPQDAVTPRATSGARTPPAAVQTTAA